MRGCSRHLHVTVVLWRLHCILYYTQKFVYFYFLLLNITELAFKPALLLPVDRQALKVTSLTSSDLRFYMLCSAAVLFH